MSEKIGIVGTGLIGASIGMALVSQRRHVLGFDPNADNLSNAKRRNCITEAATLDRLRECGLIFVAVPPLATASVLEQVHTLVPPVAVVTDCASVKGAIVQWQQSKAPDWKSFVPGHPMAGHEKSGPNFASPWLFRGAKWILTPSPSTSTMAIKTVEATIKSLGAEPVCIDPTQHDRHVALLSHIPHILAALLVQSAERLDFREAGGGSWKDLTRVGGVDPELWSQILIGNRVEVASILSEFGLEFEKLAGHLMNSDRDAIHTFFAQARIAKGDSA